MADADSCREITRTSCSLHKSKHRVEVVFAPGSDEDEAQFFIPLTGGSGPEPNIRTRMAESAAVLLLSAFLSDRCFSFLLDRLKVSFNLLEKLVWVNVGRFHTPVNKQQLNLHSCIFIGATSEVKFYCFTQISQQT